MASNVPKFTSFRPKPKQVPDPVQEIQRSELPKKRTKAKDPKQNVSSAKELGRDAAPSQAYFSDRRGDADVLRYGVLNRYDIPAYRRYGYGCILGLDSSQKIDRDHSSETKIYIVPASGKRQERLLTSKRRAKDTSGNLRFVKPATASHDVQPDFIPVSNSRAKTPGNSEDEDAEPYRMLDHDNPLDPEPQEDIYLEEVDFGSALTKKNTELVRRTRECPEEVQFWLDLINHQEAMLLFDRPTADLSDAMKLQLADTRISLYEEALKKVGNEPSKQVQLHLGLFKEAARSWDAGRSHTRWKAALAQHPQSRDLWFAYLDFIQSSFALFKYESCRTTFHECLRAFQRGANNLPAEDSLHVFIRMTRMIHDSGYQELALAIWQGLLEMYVVKTKPTDEAQLEEFWETEEPRIGDVTLPSSALHPSASSDSTFDRFQKQELDATERLRCPGRTTDDVGEDDAFHTIFFTDIEEAIKSFPKGVSSILILEVFLCFCGLPPLSRIAQHQHQWWKDPFLQHRSLSHQLTYRDSQQTSNPFVTKLQDFGACPLQSVQPSTDSLFEHDFSLRSIRLEPGSVRQILRSVSDETVGQYLLAFESRHFPSDVVKTAKGLLKKRPSSQALYHAYGLLESARGKSEKANQVFGMALSLSGDRALKCDGLKLLSSWIWEALRQGDNVEALWRLVSPSGKVPERLQPQSRPNTDTISKSRVQLSECCEQALLCHDHHTAVMSTSLLALLEYLTNGELDVDVALTTHQHLSSWFSSHKLSHSPYAELHAQLIACLLTHHVTHAAIVKPTLIRNAVEPLIALFPDNTILLSLYAANEARFAIDDRVRGIMRQSDALQEPKSVAGWAFALRYEMLKGEIAGSTSHSLRALYKRAVDSDSTGAHCPALWSSFLQFETAQWQAQRAKSTDKRPGKDGKKRTWEVRKDEARARVKETFYQGLRSLPWCKDFVMLAFTDAMEVFTEEELWKIYRVMQEKEIRVYVELE
ncbi:NRDE-2, necessary for RNA interference-domain-containing protein [Paraphoma chrysanthemicola]|uniref:NRDE-2, necessary for RNA interference-domain-containing protein n=1 Tax=Paraphoma chrysanthemicola TaxID=798071 RepID=A0A8K0VTJ3_9PLEO|nr:NRDE-2, necessary for RNA interference-domain-containing protein [Paraphoma chrysanthemicola]